MREEVDPDVELAQGRIEQLLDELRAQAPLETVAQIEELVENVVGLYGSALARVTAALEDEAVRDKRDEIVGDPLVSALLVLHGIHPYDVRARVERALALVAPYVASHGGKVVITRIEDGVVALRMEGACQSCPSSASTATDLLERAVRDAAPEIARVEVDTGASDTGASDTGIVQLGRKRPAQPSLASTVPAPPIEVHAMNEVCEMCGSPIPPAHDHVARVEARELLCVCRACRLLFAHAPHEGAPGGKYRPVATRWLVDDAYRLTDLEWARLGIPVRMAFFVADSKRGAPVGYYPSPGGVIEADVDGDAWTGIARAAGNFAALEPDVEAWLVDGRDRTTFEGWVVPIDACYELVARVRLHWSGFDGGDEARAKIDEFFATVRERAVPLATAPVALAPAVTHVTGGSL